MYFDRLIDAELLNWAKRPDHKPLLLRGARQVGKSSAVRHLGKSFSNFVEIDFEKHPEYRAIFKTNRDVKRIVAELGVMASKNIVAGETLLFFDEIQECPEAIMALRYFREDMPQLHVVAAGSLLEFALDELPTFGVARIHSMFMYPMSFDEFLRAVGENLLLEARNQSSANSPLREPLYEKIVGLFRNYLIIGGMPEAVAKWVETGDYVQCQEVQDDILMGYESDFPKYRNRVKTQMLVNVLHSAAVQVTKKFVYSQVAPDVKATDIRNAIDLLCKAGLLVAVTRTDANGLPLGGEADPSFRKILLMDTGLLLRLQNMTLGNAKKTAAEILTSSAADLVNKGQVAEMIAGLELIRYQTPNLRHELYYWARQSKNAQAEVDYVVAHDGNVLPIEVKADRQGGMKSLWAFMQDKKIVDAVRCSLENFGSFDYQGPLSDGVARHVDICPLYAISQLGRLTSS